MLQSPAGSSLTVWQWCEAMTGGLRDMVSEGTDICMANMRRAQIPEDTSTYSSKLSKITYTQQTIPPQHHQQTWWCCFVPCIFQLSSQMVDYCCCHILNTPKTKSPCAPLSLKSAECAEMWGQMWPSPIYLINQPGAGLIMCLETGKKRDRESGDSYKCFATWMWH